MFSVYHVFNEECAIFALNAETIAKRAGNLKHAVDIGAGSPMALERKLLPVLVRMPELKELSSIDIVDAFPAASAEILKQWQPNVSFKPINADFYHVMPVFNGPVLAFFVGSSISQVVLKDDETLSSALGRLLNQFASALPKGSKLLISYDGCRDAETLARAYDHPSLNAMEASKPGNHYTRERKIA